MTNSCERRDNGCSLRLGRGGLYCLCVSADWLKLISKISSVNATKVQHCATHTFQLNSTVPYIIPLGEPDSEREKNIYRQIQFFMRSKNLAYWARNSVPFHLLLAYLHYIPKCRGCVKLLKTFYYTVALRLSKHAIPWNDKRCLVANALWLVLPRQWRHQTRNICRFNVTKYFHIYGMCTITAQFITCGRLL